MFAQPRQKTSCRGDGAEMAGKWVNPRGDCRAEEVSLSEGQARCGRMEPGSDKQVWNCCCSCCCAKQSAARGKGDSAVDQNWPSRCGHGSTKKAQARADTDWRTESSRGCLKPTTTRRPGATSCASTFESSRGFESLPLSASFGLQANKLASSLIAKSSRSLL